MADKKPPREIVLDGRRYHLVPAEPGARPSEGVEEIRALLTARERQVAELVANGRLNKEIAQLLRISEWTVSSHLRRIFNKLGVENRAAMVYRLSEAFRGSKKV